MLYLDVIHQQIGSKKVWSYIKKGACKIKDEFVDIGRTFKNGDWKTKVSYFVLGFGNFARGQIGRGILFLAFELIFIFYMVLWGGYWIGQIGTLGTVGPGEIYNEIYDQYVPVYNDNSFKILLYSVLSIFSFLTLFLNLSMKSMTVLTPISAIISISSNSSKYSLLTFLNLLFNKLILLTNSFLVFSRPLS